MEPNEAVFEAWVPEGVTYDAGDVLDLAPISDVHGHEESDPIRVVRGPHTALIAPLRRGSDGS